MAGYLPSEQPSCRYQSTEHWRVNNSAFTSWLQTIHGGYQLTNKAELHQSISNHTTTSTTINFGFHLTYLISVPHDKNVIARLKSC